MKKHFELTSETKQTPSGITLHRIKATTSGWWGDAGTLGGWVESESNLYDNAWISENAHVSGSARVFGSAWVFGSAVIFGSAEISGLAKISGQAVIFGSASVFGKAEISGSARVFGEAEISGSAHVSGWAEISGQAEISGSARVFEQASVFGSARVSGKAIIFGGEWDVSPLQIQGTKHFVNVCDRFCLRIGCIDLPFKEWESRYKEIGKRRGYSASEIKEYGQYIKLAISLYGLDEKEGRP